MRCSARRRPIASIGGTQTVARRVAEKLGASIRLGRAGAQDRVDRPRRDRAFRCAERRGAPRDRRDPAEPRGRDRVCAVIAGEPRADHAALAAGPGHQGGDDLSAAVLARRRPRRHVLRSRLDHGRDRGFEQSGERVEGRRAHRLRLFRQRPQGLHAGAGRAQEAVPRRDRQALRSEGARARALSRVQLVDRSVDARLLHGLPHARRDRAARPRDARAGRADPLGRHRDRDALAVLHRRRDPLAASAKRRRSARPESHGDPGDRQRGAPRRGADAHARRRAARRRSASMSSPRRSPRMSARSSTAHSCGATWRACARCCTPRPCTSRMSRPTAGRNSSTSTSPAR